MSDILLRFPIAASPSEIFKAITTASGLDCCWAMYLRLPKQYVETGMTVPYALRLDD